MSNQPHYKNRKTLADYVLGLIVDEESKGIGSIDVAHAHIHQGLAYQHSKGYADIDAPSGFKYVLFPTGSDYEAHVTIDITVAGQAADFTIHETGSVTVSSSFLIVPANRKRSVNDFGTMLVYENPTVWRSGTKIYDTYIPAGNKLDFSEGTRHEWILAHNKYYLLNLRPAADNATGSIKIDWYEEQED